MRDSMRELKGGRRIVSGWVSAAGVILGGTGFSITHVSAGRYNINFLPPFDSTPAVEITVQDGQVGNVFNYNSPNTPQQAFFGFNNTVPAASDVVFSFVAVGPER